MLIDVVDGYEIYSAPNIIGILPRDWDRIKKETNLFTEAGLISNNNWEKVVTSTTTISKSTNKIAVTSGKINRNSNQYRTLSLSFLDTTMYPIIPYVSEG
jgi:hypothetical protein